MREDPLVMAATVFQVFISRPKRISHKVKTPDAVPVTTQACLLSRHMVVMGPLWLGCSMESRTRIVRRSKRHIVECVVAYTRLDADSGIRLHECRTWGGVSD